MFALVQVRLKDIFMSCCGTALGYCGTALPRQNACGQLSPTCVLLLAGGLVWWGVAVRETMGVWINIVKGERMCHCEYKMSNKRVLGLVWA